jgi:hypothetical protein
MQWPYTAVLHSVQVRRRNENTCIASQRPNQGSVVGAASSTRTGLAASVGSSRIEGESGADVRSSGVGAGSGAGGSIEGGAGFGAGGDSSGVGAGVLAGSPVAIGRSVGAARAVGSVTELAVGSAGMAVSSAA